MPLNQLIIPLTTTLYNTYYDPFYADLFTIVNSNQALLVKILPSAYSPIYEGKEGEISRGTNGQFITKPITYYSFEAIINDSREIVWHLLDQIITEQELLTLYDFILVPYLYRNRGYVIREGLGKIQPQSGSFLTEVRQNNTGIIRNNQRVYSDFKLRFDELRNY